LKEEDRREGIEGRGLKEGIEGRGWTEGFEVREEGRGSKKARRKGIKRRG
jgi:hypothetical protein